MRIGRAALSAILLGVIAVSAGTAWAHGERSQEPFLRMRSIQWYDMKWQPKVTKVTAVTDCGEVVNLSGAENQVKGAIIDGMGHALFAKLNFQKGVASPANFNAYRMIRGNEIPVIDAHFVNNGIAPTGLGEPALPPTGGSIANAIFAATKKRHYKQPFN